MRYLGSKTKIIPYIEKIIDKYNIDGKSFADLFAGTSCVGDYFKDKYEIISNDFMYYSYIISKAKLSFDKLPSFKRFKEINNCNIFEWLNNQEYKVDDSCFIYNNYTPVGNRMFFTEANGKKIDGIRKEIERLNMKILLLKMSIIF